MKSIKLNGSVVDLKGEAVKVEGKELKMNEVVSNLLATSKSKDAMRKLSVAQALYLDGDMEVEDADYKLIKDAVTEGNGTALVVGQILKAMGEKE